jgi:hypothetical protein
MTTPLIPQSDFNEITQLIHAARQRAVQAVNTELHIRYSRIANVVRMRFAYSRYHEL